MKSKWKILSRIEEIYFWSLEKRKNGYLHKSHLHPRLHDHIDNITKDSMVIYFTHKYVRNHSYILKDIKQYINYH